MTTTVSTQQPSAPPACCTPTQGGPVQTVPASAAGTSSQASLAAIVLQLQQIVPVLQQLEGSIQTATGSVQQSTPAAAPDTAGLSNAIQVSSPGTPPSATTASSSKASTKSSAKKTAASSTTKADPKKWVTGDTKGLNPALLDRLAEVGQKLGKKLDVVSGKRSYAEQAQLYKLYKEGKGNLAAPPGHSNHESGNAADVTVGGVSLRNDPAAKKAALAVGLDFPIASEAWHTEVKKQK